MEDKPVSDQGQTRPPRLDGSLPTFETCVSLNELKPMAIILLD